MPDFDQLLVFLTILIFEYDSEKISPTHYKLSSQQKCIPINNPSLVSNYILKNDNIFMHSTSQTELRINPTRCNVFKPVL